jgi:hypothetical protein
MQALSAAKKWACEHIGSTPDRNTKMYATRSKTPHPENKLNGMHKDAQGMGIATHVAE